MESALMVKYSLKFPSQHIYGWMEPTPQLSVSDKRDIKNV